MELPEPARYFFVGGSKALLLSRGVSLRVLRGLLWFLLDVDLEVVGLRDMTLKECRTNRRDQPSKSVGVRRPSISINMSKPSSGTDKLNVTVIIHHTSESSISNSAVV